MRRQLSLSFATREYVFNIFKLSRAKMTVISAVTHLAASVVTTTTSNISTFSVINFLTAWLFILSTQFMTHFLGEIYDRKSDTLNKYGTPLTGGSRVLQSGLVSDHTTYLMAFYSFTVSILTLLFLIPASARHIGFLIVPMAIAYSAPPFKLNHHALGELDASIITSILVPIFSAASQHPKSNTSYLHPALTYLIIPPFFVKIALFLVLNLADKRPDWASGKITIPVLLGNRKTAILHLLLMMTAYLSSIIIPIVKSFHMNHLSWDDVIQSFFILLSAPIGFSLSTQLLKQPYKLDALLAPTLLHSTLVVWAVFVYNLYKLAKNQGVLNFPFILASCFAWMTFKNLLKRKPSKGHPVDHQQQTEQRVAENNQLISKTKQLQDTSSISISTDYSYSSDVSIDSEEIRTNISYIVDMVMEEYSSKCDVVVVGAGVSGLVAAASLSQIGISTVVLEKRIDANLTESGADLALWPSAIRILKQLGIRASFFEHDCFPIEQVHMSKLKFDNLVGDDLRNRNEHNVNILKTINMSQVTEGTGEHFLLVSRQKLMNVLREIVPNNCIIYNADIVQVSENEDSESVTTKFRLNNDDQNRIRVITSRIAIGADGSRSKLRQHIYPNKSASDIIQFCGEVCYRGVLNMNELSDEKYCGESLRSKVKNVFLDNVDDRAMRINYGAGLRSSYGYMSSDGETAYWWVKEPTSKMPEYRGKIEHCTWPEPLKTLHDITPKDAFYMHAIEHGKNLSRWSSCRVVLIGDAAHVISPNMGQGACLAIEDAFTLCTELGMYWKWPDGHLEAFYNYEMSRKGFVEGVSKESKKQLVLGQLQHPLLVKMREFLLQAIPTRILQNTLKRNNFAVDEYLESFQQQLAPTILVK